MNRKILFRKLGRKVSAVIIVVAALSVFACGKKGNPRAPELTVPETIRDLKAEVQDKAVSLTWSRPEKYVDGRDLRDLAAFVIYRKEVPKACPGCPAPFRERARINVEDQQKFIQKKRFAFIDRELLPQTTYGYRVFSQLSDTTLSNPSNEAEVFRGP